MKKKIQEKKKLNQGWEFAKFLIGQGEKKIKAKEVLWSKIQLPHDWQIVDTADLYETAEGWYRLFLNLVLKEEKRVLLYFEGVYMDSVLYVNGKEAGQWKYGYTSFYFDITDSLHSGKNEILLKTVYQSPNSRWYSGAGIYRDVWLYQVPNIHFEPDGVYISAKCIQGDYTESILTEQIEAKAKSTLENLTQPNKVRDNIWQVRIQAELAGWENTLQEKDICIRVLLKDKEGKIAAEKEFISIEEKELNNILEKELSNVSKKELANFSEKELEKKLALRKGTSKAAGLFLMQMQIEVKNPALWSIEAPNCYCLELQLIQNKTIIDRIENTMGFRVFIYHPQQGFFINGNHTKIKGVCLHHDLGALGAAMHKPALIRQLNIMKEMGCNAVRTSHNPPSVQLLEAADRMGLLVLDEAFDMWERPKTEYDYARFFPEWSAKDIASWIRRDRNHPCIVMWSIGNEISDTHADIRGQELSRYLMEEVLKHDPLCNAPVTIGSNYMMSENGQKCADIVKMAGYNYAARFYETHHTQHPDWCIYGSETCSTVQSRGIYHFPFQRSILIEDDEQCSSLGNSTTSWGAQDIDQVIWEEREYPYSMGQFLWSGFDYIGEPTPYHTKNSYFGMVDTAGFAKDAFYIMQAAWLDVNTHPMIHLYPYWDFDMGQIIDIRVCSNAPEVELFFYSYLEEAANADNINVNKEKIKLGCSLGRKKIDQQHGRSIHANWQLAYTPGVLTAIAYNKEGKEIARDRKQSFGDAVKICLRCERLYLNADGEDIAFLEIYTEDKNGILVENANNRIQVEVSGEGMLIGLDNGDSTDYESYQAMSRRLFSGKLLAMIGAGTKPGEVRIKAVSKGLISAELMLPVQLPQEGSKRQESIFLPSSDKIPLWAALLPENRPEDYGKKLDKEEIPIRKLELCSNAGQVLTPENNSIIIEAVKYPKSATYNDLEWRIISETGLDVAFIKLEKLRELESFEEVGNLGKLEDLEELEELGDLKELGGLGELGNLEKSQSFKKLKRGKEEGKEKVKITAIGDGNFILRCSAKNGKDHAGVLSQIEMSAKGFGVFTINPYQFVPAALYKESSNSLGSGKEKGVATPYNTTSWILYQNLDFGSFGSDKVILPVFELNGDALHFTFWNGVPYAKESSVLGEGIYHKPSIWDTYQEQEFLLKKRIKGISDFAVMVDGKAIIKGFSFQQLQKAFMQLSALDNSGIYGDSFTLEQDAVTGIGNNVSLVFEEMDFQEKGTCRLNILGRTPLDHNTIQIRFTGKEQEISIMAEFLCSAEYNWQSFELPKITGIQTVTFVFLPGCHFDFKSFYFEKIG